MNKISVAVVGAGSFGVNHVRVLSQMADQVEFAGVFDLNLAHAGQVAQEHGTISFDSLAGLCDAAEAAIVATPTVTHEAVASQLLDAGLDVLIEKPIADTSSGGDRLAQLAARRGRILQVGHLERFNPAVIALARAVSTPLFFEIHRMSVFTPRSLDVDVVLDLMIHDLDIVLSMANALPDEVRAAGISVLSPKVDIANVRLSFPSGCIANLTASRVSTERVRKLRLFQPGEYISLDYQRQEASRVAVRPPAAIAFEPLPVTKGEPLRLELESFVDAITRRAQPLVDAWQATRSLRVAEGILDKIEQHARLVAETLRSRS